MPTTSQEDYELLERFFSFSMKEKERLILEKKLENNPVWQEKLRRYQQVDNELTTQFSDEGKAIPDVIRNGWKNQNDLNTNLTEKKSNLRLSWQWMLSIAAAFLVFTAISFWVIQMNNSPNAQQLALEFWQETPIQNSLAVRSGNDLTATQMQLQNALSAYANQEYRAVLSQLENISPTSDIYARSLLLCGQAYFGLNQIQEAITNYQTIIELPNATTKDLAYWLQALAYLQVDNHAAARTNLQLLIDGKYGFAPKAAELLEVVKSSD